MSAKPTRKTEKSFTCADDGECIAKGCHVLDLDGDGYCDSCGFADSSLTEEQKTKFGLVCECSNLMPGLRFPTGDSNEQQAFVERCDSCNIFTSDVEAASFIGRLIGKPWKKWYDEPLKPYFKPYFEMSEVEALELDRKGLQFKVNAPPRGMPKLQIKR
jgi:hypothetical protein